MPNHNDFSQGTLFPFIQGMKRSITALSETVYHLNTKKLIDNARAISIFVFGDHAIDLIPILRLPIILWDTISSREVNLGSSMKINQTISRIFLRVLSNP